MSTYSEPIITSFSPLLVQHSVYNIGDTPAYMWTLNSHKVESKVIFPYIAKAYLDNCSQEEITRLCRKEYYLSSTCSEVDTNMFRISVIALPVARNQNDEDRNVFLTSSHNIVPFILKGRYSKDLFWIERVSVANRQVRLFDDVPQIPNNLFLEMERSMRSMSI